MDLIDRSAAIASVTLLDERGREADDLCEQVLGRVDGEEGGREGSEGVGFVSDRDDDSPGASTSASEGPEQALVSVWVGDVEAAV